MEGGIKVIKYSKRFLQKLFKQTKFIARDQPYAAEKFEIELLRETLKIAQTPFDYKKSPFFNDENIREMIFKGYRVVFKIFETEIKVFGFNKWEETLKM